MRSSFKNFNQRNNCLIILPGLILACLSILLRYRALNQTSFANGWDSYFYLVQLKSWLETGVMHSPDHSLIYWLLRSIYVFVGDYIMTFKVTAALLAGGATFAFYCLSFKWSDRLSIAILIGAISLWSPHLTYFAAQYPKNLLGFIFLLGFLFSLPGKRLWLTAIWLLLCFFGHRLAFGVAVIYGLSYIVFEYFTFKRLAIILGSGLILLLLSQLLPGMPNWSDFQRFDGLLSFEPQFSLISFIKSFGANARISLWWMTELILAAVLPVLSIPFIRKNEKRKLVWPLIGVSILLLFPFFEWSLTGMAYRFFLFYVLLAPLYVVLFLKIKKQLSHRLVILGCSVTLMLLSMLSWRSYQPQKHDADYHKYATLTRQAQGVLSSKNIELVIMHNALAEYFTFSTNTDAMPWLPEYKIDSTQVWRIATDIRFAEFGYYLSEAELTKIHKLSVRYFLLPEFLWQKVLLKAREEEDQFLLDRLNTWRNPNRIRPGFLLKDRSKH